MQVGDLVQYVDPATRAIPNTPMPLVLLGVVLEIGIKTSMVGGKIAKSHALVQWNNQNNQRHWLPIEYLEVICK